jgi:hypothetical protein
MYNSPRDELTDMACIEVSVGAASSTIYDTDVEQFVKGTRGNGLSSISLV